MFTKNSSAVESQNSQLLISAYIVECYLVAFNDISTR